MLPSQTFDNEWLTTAGHARRELSPQRAAGAAGTSMNTKSSLKSLLSYVALAAAVLSAGTAVAATVPVYGSVSDITENTVILTGDATVTSSKGVGGNVANKIHFSQVAGRSVLSDVALQAVSDQTVVKL